MKETQRFKRWWIWMLLITINGFFIYAIIQQIILGKPFGNKPATNTELILIEIIPLVLTVFIAFIKLDTSINEEGIHYRFSPFHFSTRLIEWDELSAAYLRQYNSFYEYGGWGIRIGKTTKDKALNTTASGNIGLQLEFKNGQRLLIGTAKPEAIKEVLDKFSAQGKIGWKV